jgi:hypothetical protein
MRCIELKICLVLHQNPASNFGTTYFFLFTYQKGINEIDGTRVAKATK